MSAMELLEGLRQGDYADTLAEVVGRVDLLAFSPPYEDARTYGADVSWTFADYQRLGDCVKAALRPDGGQCLMVLDGPVRDYRGDGFTERSVMPWRVLLDWKDRLGLVCPSRLTFGRRGYPGAYLGGFRNDDEPLLWFANPGRRVLNKESIATRGNLKSTGSGMGQSVAGRRSDGSIYRQRRGGNAVKKELRMPGTVWEYGTVGGDHQSGVDALERENHPARFPYRLASDLVKCFSNPGDLVVDPFLGSGTTLVAALDHGRRFFGGDLLARVEDGKPWIDVAREIAEARYAQRTIFEAESESMKAEQLLLDGWR